MQQLLPSKYQFIIPISSSVLCVVEKVLLNKVRLAKLAQYLLDCHLILFQQDIYFVINTH
jgi:hypothetical protein